MAMALCHGLVFCKSIRVEVMCPIIVQNNHSLSLFFFPHVYFLCTSLSHKNQLTHTKKHPQPRCRYRIGVRLADHRLCAQPVAEAAAVLVRHSGLRPVRGHGSVLFDDGLPAAVRLLRSADGAEPKQSKQNNIITTTNNNIHQIRFDHHRKPRAATRPPLKPSARGPRVFSWTGE